jgi:hypothetical protein
MLVSAETAWFVEARFVDVNVEEEERKGKGGEFIFV